ncbi:cap-specific mRNA (nucleoside-2'-O-)-methyltransferase 1 isoform X1 [Lucilia sericata]|uniref:cap-specific mRNA (nucleoside-2'-O-)-methyltransferase 1 isoform X1 n=1 Tax=Lucilia sericata TaxID=13632 RepID=UPI0018A84CA8|nr:cap-specific mRNA (nucleoside-2'-O-)-methyltransferase 1 isoform X1 [Lucilia sericata]
MEGEDNSENELYEVVPKKMKTEWSKSYSNKAMEMMKKMGYETDKGLGKQSQGRLEPIVAFQQDGRRGLGLKHESVQHQGEHWDPNIEKITVPEVVSWISSSNNFTQSIQQLMCWISFGERKETLDDETLFVEPEILNAILEAKTVFDKLNENELRKARSRSNPFETIRSSIFQNRAAVKMANIDSMLDFMFTNPKDKMGNSLIHDNDLLYFADICAGPGGFSEYILYRKSWEAKGFGFTLRGANDFKLDKFSAGSPESFDPFYGIQGDGDVYVEANQDSFASYIFKHCEEGVHFVMADGGFSVEGQENIQEILSKQLYLCQCLTALKILRCNGSFVCKLFDIFTPFSVGLVYLMYQCFEEIAIIKPNSSRPANSERYLVCKWKKSDTEVICKYLNLINNHINKQSDRDVLEIVDLDVIMQDEDFFKYIKESNNLIGSNQIIGLKKISAYCNNPLLKETRQTEFRKKCLELWRLPDKLRQAPENKSVEKFLEEFLNNWYEDKVWFNSTPVELVSSSMLNKWIESIHDWYFVPIGRGETSANACSFFICTTRGKLLRYTDMKKWEPVEYMFELSPKSLFYGELVFEYNGEGRTQTRTCSLHIIDAIMLGGKDVRRLRLNERLSMCTKFAKSINKPYKEGGVSLLRCKRLFKLEDIDEFFGTMRHYRLKDGAQRLGISLNDTDTKFFVPGGILLFCEICHYFFSIMSKSQNMLYYYNKTRNASYYKNNMPDEMQNILYASFRNSFIRRLLWKWTNTYQVEERSNKVDDHILYRDDFIQYIVRKRNM